MKNAAAWLLIAAGIPLVAPAEAEPGAIWRGIFTPEQARRGEIAYQGNCAGCHGSNLVAKDPEAPPLTAQAFNFGWHRKTIAERFARIRATMPNGAAGKLSDQEYLDIVVYILSFNGYPPGSQELKLDPDLLKEIVIEPGPAPK
jgi:S-disulfanyl-L-cysteine oxidoreductase SoxD